VGCDLVFRAVQKGKEEEKEGRGGRWEKVIRVHYTLYVLSDRGQKRLLETDNIDDVLERIKEIAKDLEYLCEELLEPREMIDLKGFKIYVEMVEEG
jgi:pantothenate kinase